MTLGEIFEAVLLFALLALLVVLMTVSYTHLTLPTKRIV